MSQQRGSMLVIAIFTMVVLLLSPVSLQRMLVSSQQSIVYEVYGARAYNAAQSGIDHHLTLLFPTDNSDGSSRCTEQPRRHHQPMQIYWCISGIFCRWWSDELSLSNPMRN